MKKIDLVVLSDLEHSSPRIPNLLSYLDNKIFNLYIITAEYSDSLTKDDFPVNFKQKVKILKFKRKINFYRGLKNTFGSNLTSKTQNQRLIINLLKKIFLKVSLNILFPDQYYFSKKRYIKIFNQEFKQKDNKIFIMSSFPYATSHVVASTIKKQNPNIKWIADYRDLWYLNQAYSHIYLRKLIDGQYERNKLKNADIITTVTVPWSKRQGDFLNKNINFIPNGYSESVNQSHNNFKIAFDPNKRYILYVGAIYFNAQDALLFLDSIANVNNKNFEIHFMGEFSLELDKLINKFNLSRVVKQIGKFSRQEAQSLQLMYDSLIFFDHINDPAVLPLKFYEYIGANKPLICIGGKDDSEPKKILKKINRGKILKKKQNIIDFFEKELMDYRPSINSEISKKFSYRESSKQLQELILKNLN